MKKLLLIFFVTVLITGCSNQNSENNCVEQEVSFITEVRAPHSGIVNKKIEIEVSFNIKNGCGKFLGFEESNTLNSKIIKVNTIYEGCVCTEIFEMKTVIYNFTATEAGIYELKFLKGENEYIVVMITIV